MVGKRALITGISGQDGFYLAELLAQKGMEVLGIDQTAVPVAGAQVRTLDVTNSAALRDLIANFAPDECYHLAAYHRSSSVAVASERDDEQRNLAVNLSATHSLLRAIIELRPSCRVFIAGSCHMFGTVASSPQTEQTPFQPNSPYGIAKVAVCQLARMYRQRRLLFCSMGILYNHESPRRSPDFVSSRIARSVVEILRKKRSELVLGSLTAQVDWGFAGDYVEAMWRMLQHDQGDDFIVASGSLHRVQDFVELAFQHVGLDWRRYVKEDAATYRPVQCGVYQGDITKIRNVLGWKPTTELPALVAMMVDHELEAHRGSLNQTVATR